MDTRSTHAVIRAFAGMVIVGAGIAWIRGEDIDIDDLRAQRAYLFGEIAKLREQRNYLVVELVEVRTEIARLREQQPVPDDSVGPEATA